MATPSPMAALPAARNAMPSGIAPRAGIGLRGQHHAAMLEARPGLGFLEVHAENYMGGGAPRWVLEQLRRDYPVSVHGVGMNLAGIERPEARHLAKFAELCERIEPAFISEHLAWSMLDGVYFNDLLPVPYTDETLKIAARNIGILQDRLRRVVLIENPSTYLRFRDSLRAEAEFLSNLSASTGCGLLCDVNNIYVSAVNHAGEAIAETLALDYLTSLPAEAVREIHLAGHSRTEADGVPLLIDDHGAHIAEPVWRLYARAVQLFPEAATLIEWDSSIPPLEALASEARLADQQRATALEQNTGEAQG